MQERAAHLDSLRGLAALAVVFSHYFLAYDLPPAVAWAFTQTPLHIFWDGFAAVSLFFVLSGYVLSRKYFAGAAFPGYLPFAAARVVRIWLPFAAAFALSLALWWILPPRHGDPASAWLAAFWRQVDPWWPQLFFLGPRVGEQRLLPQDWTLWQELLLSLLLPLFLWVARRWGWALLPLCLALIFTVKIPILSFHFCLGVALARYEPFFRRNISRAWLPLLLVAGLAAYTFRFSFPLWWPGLIPEQRIWYVTGLGAGLLLLHALLSPAAAALLSCRPLEALGRYSYGLYLIHFAWLVALVPRTHALFGSLGWAEGSSRTLTILVLYVLFCLGTSALFFRWVDQPCIGLARRCARARWRREQVAHGH